MNKIIKNRIEQINNGIVPEGYAKTACGVLPCDWDEKPLGKLFVKNSTKNNVGNSNVLTISARYGLINQKEFFNKEIASDDKTGYYLLEKNDFAYNKSYSAGYPYGAIKKLRRYQDGIVSPLYICFRQQVQDISLDFYEQVFEHGILNHQIKSFAQEGARNHGLLNLSVGSFFASKVPAPDVAEQEKIAKILTLWDRCIEVQKSYIEKLELRKKGLMQKMLTEKPHWESKKIADIIEECRIKNDGLLIKEVNSVSNTKGFVSQIEQFNKSIASEDLSNYKVVEADCFAYNPSRINVGSIALNTTGNKKIVSPMYNVFKCKNDTNSIFLLMWIKGPKFKCQLRKYLSGSVRDSLNISDMSLFNISVPPLGEQRDITVILSAADREIEVQKQKLSKLEKQLKSLMQLLLTGIVRV